jgi:hypothetical protein
MRPARAIWVALGVLGLAWLAVVLRDRGPAGLPYYPGCMFRKWTGLNCPGCGMTRASYAVLHGDLATAFAMNPLGMVVLPLALVGIALELAGWVRGRPPSYRLSLGTRGTWALVVLVFVYWIARNLPWWPFTLLAPG